MSGGPCGRGPDDVGEGPPRGRRRPRRVGHQGGTSGGSPTGAARGGGNAPDEGPAAAATGPSWRCRCRDGPLWGGDTKAFGYAGGFLFQYYCVLTWNSVSSSR